jgi:hypothetical protein
MRGMIKGEWHVDLAQASSWNDEIAASFQTPASRVPIDLEQRWCRLSEQIFRVAKWSLGRG